MKFYLIALISLLPSSLFGMKTVERFRPIEILVPRNQSMPGMKNVWQDLPVNGTFTDPNGRQITVNGFYHSKNLWMVRVAPDVIGTWRYSLVLQTMVGPTPIINDSFQCVASNEQGFIRLHPNDQKRWIYSGTGNLYTAVGFGDCMGANRDSILETAGLDGGYRPKGYHEGIEWILPYSQYLTAFGDAGGFNIYRFSDGNCAYSNIKNISASGNDYDTLHMRWTDTLFYALRAHGFRIYMTIMTSPQGNSSDINSMAATERYVQHCIDRYGSLVDFWELTNESNPDSLWISMVAGYFHDHDPYHHLVSMSNATPNHPAIDIISPHWYGAQAAENSDIETANQINTYRQIPKPVIFGEQGDGTVWGSLSGLRMRGRIWSALFNEGTIIFWNATFARDCACNQYLGWEERRYARVLQNFSVLLDSGVRRGAPGDIGTIYRVWSLRSSKLQALYLRNYRNVMDKNNLPYVPVDIPTDGEAIWYDVHTGDILQKEQIKAGTHTLLPPAFQTDIAFIGGAITEPAVDSLFRIDVNPRTEELLKIPIKTQQNFSVDITNIGTKPITLLKAFTSWSSKLLTMIPQMTFPLVLNPSQMITMPVQYIMSDTGGTAATLSIQHDGSPAWENIAISATGAPKSDVAENNSNNESLKIFPDPANDKLSVEWQSSDQGKIMIRLVTIAGSLIEEKTSEPGIFTFDTSKIANGFYQVIILKNGEILGSHKISIVH